jgi:Domain of unknown function (DUF2017)
MPHRFRRSRHGLEIRLSRAEALMLRQLAEDLIQLLESSSAPAPVDPLEALVGMSLSPMPKPVDPVLARLLPDGYTDDEEAAADFRRYTEPELRSAKRSALRAVVTTLSREGGKTVLDQAAAGVWLTAINDLRLALGTRLEVTEDLGDTIERMAPDDSRLPHLSVYEWLGGLEESLVQALAG